MFDQGRYKRAKPSAEEKCYCQHGDADSDLYKDEINIVPRLHPRPVVNRTPHRGQSDQHSGEDEAASEPATRIRELGVEIAGEECDNRDGEHRR